MSFTQIRLDVSESIATITLDRPDRLNAFTTTMMSELIEAFDRTDADDDVGAVIVTGAGRAFCAGADLSSGGDTFDHGERADGRPARDGGGLVTLRVFKSLKPVIAAINGPAVGIGITMTLPMDIRLISDEARVGFVFARRGIVPEAASSWFLPRIVGISRALEWTYSGRLLDAHEALAGGLVRSVHPPDQLLVEARRLAEEIIANSAPVSVALTRRMLWRMLVADHPMEAHRADSRAMTARGRSADAREGIASFLEKRTPDFRDRVSAELPDAFPDWVDPPFA